jgi:hypothetical protein
LSLGSIFYPSIWMPIDYIEEIEYKRSRGLQEKNGDGKWGLEIGIRYFPSKEYFPPVFLHENFIF